jgi:hypothetical protein
MSVSLNGILWWNCRICVGQADCMLKNQKSPTLICIDSILQHLVIVLGANLRTSVRPANPHRLAMPQHQSSDALISTLQTELCREPLTCQGQITSGIRTSDRNARTQKPCNGARTSAISVQFILLNHIKSADTLNM